MIYEKGGPLLLGIVKDAHRSRKIFYVINYIIKGHSLFLTSKVHLVTDDHRTGGKETCREVKCGTAHYKNVYSSSGRKAQ